MAAEQDTSADSFLPTSDYYVRELVKSKNYPKLLTGNSALYTTFGLGKASVKKDVLSY